VPLGGSASFGWDGHGGKERGDAIRRRRHDREYGLWIGGGLAIAVIGAGDIPSASAADPDH